jgi:hypothetical protein
MTHVTYVIAHMPGKIFICEPRGIADFDVTYQEKNAKPFLCREDAMHEILRLGLGGNWRPYPKGSAALA